MCVVIRRGHAAPRTGPQQRPGAATVGRGGGANGRQCCRRIRGARLDWRPRMAVTWLFKDAGLACAVCADLDGLIIVKSGRGSSAAFAEGKGSSTVRKAVSSCEAWHVDKDLGVLR